MPPAKKTPDGGDPNILSEVEAQAPSPKLKLYYKLKMSRR